MLRREGSLVEQVLPEMAHVGTLWHGEYQEDSQVMEKLRAVLVLREGVATEMMPGD